MRHRVLTVAGSDSSGGAGIQADLKTFTVLGAYGLSVITALTAQNTHGVQGVADVEPDFVRMQLHSVLSDIGADALKTGMLNKPEVVEAVADAIEHFKVPHVVVDPVMVSKSGHKLLQPNAVSAVIKRIIPLASVVTPNTEEAALLAGMSCVSDARDMHEAAESIIALGAKSVVIKGGHLSSATSDDLWFDGHNAVFLSTPRYNNRHTHGTGCTFSAALAVYLSQGFPQIEAVRMAKDFISEAIRTSTPLGGGIGPVNHMWDLEQ